LWWVSPQRIQEEPLRVFAKSLLAGAFGAFALTAVASAQTFPSQRITFIVGLPPGASTDTLSRILADKLKDRLGQPVVVENRVGGGGSIAAEVVAKAPPDGHTIGLGTQVNITAPLFIKAAAYDPLKDFTWIGRIAEQPFLIITNTTVPGTLKEFIAHAKANPGKLNYATVPNSMMQLDQIRFNKVAGIDIVEVPYNGAAQMVQAQLADQAQLAQGGAGSLPHIREGKLRAIAVSSRERFDLAPDVPTTFEQGLEYESAFWYGIVLPGATPQPIVARWEKELQEVMKLADVQADFKKQGMRPLLSSVADATAYVKKEQEQAVAAAKAANIVPK
jgi:tripartite-type tricarboxylate transporter receptor subunit TctC